jgi:hypothetical protein
MVRRESIGHGIYRRPTDGKLEIGWRDAGGRQRWRTVDGGIETARAELGIELAKRNGTTEPDPEPTLIGALLDCEQRLSEIRDELQAIRAEARR